MVKVPGLVWENPIFAEFRITSIQYTCIWQIHFSKSIVSELNLHIIYYNFHNPCISYKNNILFNCNYHNKRINDTAFINSVTINRFVMTCHLQMSVAVSGSDSRLYTSQSSPQEWKTSVFRYLNLRSVANDLKVGKQITFKL